MPSYEMFPSIFMGVVLIVFEKCYENVSVEYTPKLSYKFIL